MWPKVNIEKGEIENLGFSLVRQNEEVCKSPTTCIKEIIMIYARGEDVSYDENDVPLVVNYYTEFGWHTILFSTKQDLPYKIGSGIEWIAKFTSKPISDDIQERAALDNGEYVPEEKLTAMFKNMLKYNFLPRLDEDIDVI